MTMSERLRIGYLGIKGLPSKAGADRVVEAIVRRLAARHEITVYCSPLVVPADGTFPGVELVRAPVVPGKHAHATTLFLTSALDAVLRRDFDLIHLHNAEASFVMPLLKLRYPVLATSHGLAYARDKWSPLAKRLMQWADWPFVKLSDDITSVSQTAADYYGAQYGREVRYIPNGVGAEDTEQDLDGAQAWLRERTLAPEGYLMFAAGRVIPTKGGETLLTAYGQLPDAPPLLIVGDTEPGSAHERRLRQMADGRVHFVPAVDKALLLGLARLARLFIFPSWIEAMSRMLLEAALAGVPLVCSDIVENVAVVDQHALYFRSQDAADLHAKLAWALAHPAGMASLGAAASRYVQTRYPWDGIVDEYERLYYACVRGRNGHQRPL